MLKRVKTSTHALLNRVDRRLRLGIFPRDRLYRAESRDLASFSRRTLVLDTGMFGLDMYYYSCPFTYRGEEFLCFQGTRLARKGSESHLLVIDAKRRVLLDLCASDAGFASFASPQVLLIDGSLQLFFCATREGKSGLYRRELTELVARKRPARTAGDAPAKGPELVRAGPVEHWLLPSQKAFYLFFTDAANGEIQLLKTSDFVHYLKVGISFSARETYAFLNNPTVIAADGVYHLFCRLSTKNALGSKVVSFVSHDLHTFVQTHVELLPRAGVERHATAFPSIAKSAKGYTLYYTGYWGKHLVEKRTLGLWR